MENNRKLITIAAVLVIVGAGIYYFMNNAQAKPETHRSLVVAIDQISENFLELKNAEIRAIYPASAYQNAKLDKYYQAKILARNGEVLFSTQIPKVSTVSRFTYPGYEAHPPVTSLNENIDLYLPVYSQSEKLTIEDELGNTIVSINLKSVE